MKPGAPVLAVLQSMLGARPIRKAVPGRVARVSKAGYIRIDGGLGGQCYKFLPPKPDGRAMKFQTRDENLASTSWLWIEADTPAAREKYAAVLKLPKEPA